MPSVYTAIGNRSAVFRNEWEHDVCVYEGSSVTIVANTEDELVEAMSKYENAERTQALLTQIDKHWAEDNSRSIIENWTPNVWSIFIDGYPFIATTQHVIKSHPYVSSTYSANAERIVDRVEWYFEASTERFKAIVNSIESFNLLRKELEQRLYKSHRGTIEEIMKIAREQGEDSDFYKDALLTTDMIEENHQRKVASLKTQIENDKKKLEEYLK